MRVFCNKIALTRATCVVQDPVMTMVVQAVSETNSQPVSLNKSMNDNLPTIFMGYAPDNRLLYVRNRSSIVESLESGRVVLKAILSCM